MEHKIYCNIHKIQKAMLTRNIMDNEFYFQCSLCYNEMLLKIINSSKNYSKVSRADSRIYLNKKTK